MQKRPSLVVGVQEIKELIALHTNLFINIKNIEEIDRTATVNEVYTALETFNIRGIKEWLLTGNMKIKEGSSYSW